MDTSDPNIKFDESGVCHHCYQYQKRSKDELPTEDEQKLILQSTVEKIKISGLGKTYDCLGSRKFFLNH